MKWPTSWIGNVLAVFSIAIFGALIAQFFDGSTNLQTWIQALSSLVLAVAATYGLATWKEVERTKSRAKIALDIYEKLNQIKSNVILLDLQGEFECLDLCFTEIIENNKPEELDLYVSLSSIENRISQVNKLINETLPMAVLLKSSVHETIKTAQETSVNIVYMAALLKGALRIQLGIKKNKDKHVTVLDAVVAYVEEGKNQEARLQECWRTLQTSIDSAISTCQQVIDYEMTVRN